MPGIFEPSNYDRFLTIEFGKRVQDLDFLKIDKEIANACSKEPKIMVQNDGSLLVETKLHEDSLKLQSLTKLSGDSAKCIPHSTMNKCRGVIRSTLLMRYSEERVLEEFDSEKVVEVKQMKKKINGILTPLPV